MERTTGKVVAVNVSPEKGMRKKAVPGVRMVPEHGIEGDAHAGPWHRQVSLLSDESVEKMRSKGLHVGPGDFAENITVSGIDLMTVRIGQRIRVGQALLEITQIGKECHSRCAIYYQAGDCVMPREGLFARVVEGGMVAPGDDVSLVP